MNRQLLKEEKEALRAKYSNKVWELAYYLLAYDVGCEDFNYIMQGGEDVNVKSYKQRQEWLAQATKRMDERLSADLIKEMREGSACCLGGERHKLAKQIHDEHATVDERFAVFAQTKRIIGDTAYKVDEDTYRIFFWEHPPENARCACLKYVPKKEAMSPSWCLCCGGHIKYHFETALGVKADCTCLSSLLSSCGKQPCAFELKIREVID